MTHDAAAGTSARTQALYQDRILDHCRAPRHRHALAGATGEASLRNPLCGDVVTMRVALDGGVVRGAAFEGQGCSIATATASMLTDALPGRSRSAARALLDAVAALVEGAPEPALSPDDPEELRALGAVARYPGRRRCATLPLEALRAALDASS